MVEAKGNRTGGLAGSGDAGRTERAQAGESARVENQCIGQGDAGVQGHPAIGGADGQGAGADGRVRANPEGRLPGHGRAAGVEAVAVKVEEIRIAVRDHRLRDGERGVS